MVSNPRLGQGHEQVAMLLMCLELYEIQKATYKIGFEFVRHTSVQFETFTP